MKNAAFIFSQEQKTYKFSDDHPFNQKRLELTFDLLNSCNALNNEHIYQPRIATDDELYLIHDKEYVDAVKLASKGEIKNSIATTYGIGTDDTPIFENMHEAAALLVGGTLTAVDLVMEEKYLHACNLSGGLHHGFKGRASGFCIYNDSSIAIEYIRKKYNAKVLYVDTDAHHGDGVQWAFYDHDDVCTLSIHETGRFLFPGTGNINERGSGKGYGYSVNIPLDAFTEDESWLHAYKTSLWEVAEFFKPDVILTQNGVDSHYYDPLTHLCSTIEIYREIPKLAHEIAHQFCKGKWIAVGGGGYDIWRVVPRAWSMLWLEMTDNQIATGPLPKEWIEKWQKESPVELPKTWEDVPSFYPEIPRRNEISEKNAITVEKSLSYIRNEVVRRKGKLSSNE